MENNYGSVKMGSYDVNLRPSAPSSVEYEAPASIKAYQMEGAGGGGGGVLSAPTMRIMP